MRDNGDASANKSKDRSSFFDQLPSWLVSIPFVLAALGICYDVGYFARIGLDLFPLFSLSEHLVFGMQGIPEAVVVLTFGLIPFAIAYTLRRTVGESGKPFPKEFFIGLVVGSLIGGALTMWVFSPHLIWLYLGQVAYIGLAFWLISSQKTWSEQLTMLVGAIALGLVLLAFAFGYARAHVPEEGSASINPATISLTDGPLICGRVLRSGERGLLLRNALNGTIHFRRWDDIRAIEVEEVERKPWRQAWRELWQSLTVGPSLDPPSVRCAAR
jgi:hypothetical protein